MSRHANALLAQPIWCDRRLWRGYADMRGAETEARASLREMAADAIRSGAVVAVRGSIADADGAAKASVGVADVITGPLKQALVS